MIKIILIIGFCTVEARTQNENLFHFSQVQEKMVFFGTKSPQNDEGETVEESTSVTNDISQCIYDFKGFRLNKGCTLSSQPPVCEKGVLVQTTINDEYEMCCCNY
jgi:hypothetical protein